MNQENKEELKTNLRETLRDFPEETLQEYVDEINNQIVEIGIDNIKEEQVFKMGDGKDIGVYFNIEKESPNLGDAVSRKVKWHIKGTGTFIPGLPPFGTVTAGAHN